MASTEGLTVTCAAALDLYFTYPLQSCSVVSTLTCSESLLGLNHGFMFKIHCMVLIVIHENILKYS